VLQPPTRRHAHWLLLALIVLAGLGLRFYQLGALPPGLYQDEAYNGLDALTVLDGARPIFFPANNGREPFYIYMVAAGVAALGRTPLAVRLPAAIVGGLTILAAYALGRSLYHPRLGLLAAAVTALTFWPVALSRIGLRAGSLPLFLALGLACAAAGWRRSPRHLGLLALGGALYGFTFYTYLSSRFVPVALFAFLVFWYSAQRQTFPTVRELAAFLVPAGLIALPLFVAGLRQPEILLGRVGQVSVLNPAINGGDLAGTLLRNVAAGLGMFNWRGDDIARHNLPGRPVFDLLLGAAFLAGVFRLGWQALSERRLSGALLLAWVGTLLLPTILAEDTPHFLRAVGVLPAVCLVAASGLDWLWAARGQWAPLRRVLVVAALLAGGLLTTRV
jgi:4-amino-4-deoxy-L-arabinose transferase-like glycosyltransferase